LDKSTHMIKKFQPVVYLQVIQSTLEYTDIADDKQLYIHMKPCTGNPQKHFTQLMMNIMI